MNKIKKETFFKECCFVYLNSTDYLVRESELAAPCILTSLDEKKLNLNIRHVYI